MCFVRPLGFQLLAAQIWFCLVIFSKRSLEKKEHVLHGYLRIGSTHMCRAPCFFFFFHLWVQFRTTHLKPFTSVWLFLIQHLCHCECIVHSVFVQFNSESLSTRVNVLLFANNFCHERSLVDAPCRPSCPRGYPTIFESQRLLCFSLAHLEAKRHHLCQCDRTTQHAPQSICQCRDTAESAGREKRCTCDALGSFETLLGHVRWFDSR